MSATLYYFTGTGNSLFIAKRIASELKDVTLVPINQALVSKDINIDTDIVGVIYPTYFLEAPKRIREFTSRLKVSQSSYLFLFANCGGMLGNALYDIYQIFQEKGITVNASYSVALPDNSIVLPTKPELIDGMLTDGAKTIQETARLICEKKSTSMPKRSIPDKCLGSVMKVANHVYYGMDKIQITAGKCTNCGICTKVCSCKNISVGASAPIVGDNCAMCFSCIHCCPQQAVRFKRMKSKGNYQYQNPHVSLKEIMDSRY